jgi:hypothetical protein
MGKVDGGAQGLGDPFVLGSHRTIVQRECMRPIPERLRSVTVASRKAGVGSDGRAGSDPFVLQASKCCLYY